VAQLKIGSVNLAKTFAVCW